MTPEILELVIAQSIKASPKRVRFQWHGGEPLLAGIQFYQNAVALQEKYLLPDQKIINSIQTNGTLINEDWVAFLKEACFGIGVSLDGPEHLHNFARVDAAGKGTFTRVMRGVRLLRKSGIKFGIIAVINRHNVSCPREMYEFFSREKLSFSPNPCVMRNPETDEPFGLSVDPMDYARFMIQVCDLWLSEDDPKFRVRPLVNIVQGLLGVSHGLCEFRGTCEQFLTIDSNGDIYPCDRFLHDEFCFGNLTDISLNEVTETAAYQVYYVQRTEIAERCGNCEWFSVCSGGCLRHWEGLIEKSGFARNRFCEARKHIFRHVKMRLEQAGAL